jgi:hypothetical protein
MYVLYQCVEYSSYLGLITVSLVFPHEFLGRGYQDLWKSALVSEENIASMFKVEYAEQATSAKAGGNGSDMFFRNVSRF